MEKMTSVRLDMEQDMLFINLPVKNNEKHHDSVEAVFPFSWLRDNCQCEECFDANSCDRKFSLQKLDPDIQPVKAVINTDHILEVTWPDEHKSVFSLTWLSTRRFVQENWSEHERLRCLPMQMWYAEDMADKIPTFEYSSIQNNRKTLFEWLFNLETHGICLITGAPPEWGVIKAIGSKISHLSPCHYGETSEVKLSLSASNLVYNNKRLAFHTDFPSLSYAPEMQMLHCLQQARVFGGESILVDAFRVAYDIKENDEKSFKILCDTQVDFKDAGSFNYPFHFRTKRPVFQCDPAGELVQVNYSNTHRDSVLKLPVNEVRPFYKALTLFENMINDSKYRIEHKLQPGEIICFDNFRVMHGREGFNESKTGERHLLSGYIGWDYLKSTRRVLQKEFEQS